jgi:hypothetical protein
MQEHKIVTGIVRKNAELADEIFEMCILTDACKNFVPGQFINIYLDDKSMLLPRPISICRADSDSVTIIYKVVGQGTKHLAAYGEKQAIKLSTPLGNGYSKIGAVLGATSSRFSIIGSFGKKMRKMMPKTFFLIPGYGAQGGTGKDVKDFFDKDGRGCIVNSSRGIIAAYQKNSKYGEENFADAARDAAEIMKKDIQR